MIEKISILKLDISRNKLDEIVKSSISMVKDGARHYVCVPNAHLAVVANDDSEILNIINNAYFVIPDGMPLVWYSKTFSKPLLQRISGYDFFINYCKYMDREKMSCFFFGGENEEVVKKVISRLREDFSGIKVKGYFVPPFLPEFNGGIKKEIADVINTKKPDIVWVGLSAPKQEKWIYDNIDNLDIGMACGIGAAFNFYSSSVRRAPKWMQKSGFEWLYRAFAEPKRLMKKYFIYNTKFIILVLKDIFKRVFRLAG